MATGIEISTDFINAIVLPVLKKELPADYSRLAVAIIGTGSETLGLDDEISRDHHWGPRANVMYLRADEARLDKRIQTILQTKLPKKYLQYEVHADLKSWISVCSTSVENFIETILGVPGLPTRDLDWLQLCEMDLLHVTGGKVVSDGPGELTRYRQHLAYYPDNVWKKRVADWCAYAAHREGAYNVQRSSRRGDEITSTMYLGQAFKRIMELCFLLNKQYAPYTKWLNRSYRRLPKYVDRIAPALDAIMAEKVWKQRVIMLAEVQYALADAVADLGLTRKPVRRPFDEGLTVAPLYESAAEIYSHIPAELFYPSFSTVEYWERLARQVLFDTSDFFQKRVFKEEVK
jgi:hypothetical protein